MIMHVTSMNGMKRFDQFIFRDRNHPFIFMWSIGNEVLEQWSDAQADTLMGRS